MRRISIILLVAVAMLAMFTGIALANYGPHGGYAQDTDACAGCHRAHTSFSSLGWTGTDGITGGSALLVSNASTMTQFCYACHGDAAPGASTNVQSGRFDSGPTTAGGAAVNPAVGTLYRSNSSFDTTLNGGGFDRIGPAGAPLAVISTHGMEQNNAPTWGDIVGGVGQPGSIGLFRCTSCHDPHGSSNYRLLKDSVNNRTVGGYDKVTPDAYVVSNEPGFPGSGFRRGAAGVADMSSYVPNYTIPQYSQFSGRSMSKWCAACHTSYVIENDTAAPVTGDSWSYAAAPNGTYNYGAAEQLVDGSGNPTANQVGPLPRHRHPIDIPISLGLGASVADGGSRRLITEVLRDPGLPLEAANGFAFDPINDTTPWDDNSNITCLTCHRAHGTQAAMSGWARAQLATQKAVPGTPPDYAPRPNGTVGGVNPNFSAALLRYDNRGVCQRCHDK